MKAKIVLNQALTQDRYGLHFDKGEAYTENEYLIKKLKAKGVKVEIVQEEQEETEKALEDMTIKELTKVATEKGIEVPNKSKKADIIKLLNVDNEEILEETAVKSENEETTNDTANEETTGENTESEEETTTEETSNEEETTTNTENEKEVSEE